MRDILGKNGLLATVLFMVVWGCEVETNFTPNDAVGTQHDAVVQALDITPSDGATEIDSSSPPCGGDCGIAEECVGDTCTPTYCPPEGPFGVMPGDTLTDVVVKDCEGNDVHIHELCGANAGFFNLLAGW